MSTFHRPPPAHITAQSGAGLGRTWRIRGACGGDLLAHWPQPTQVSPPQARSPPSFTSIPSLAGERPDPITTGPGRAEGAVPQYAIELRPSLGQRLLPNGNSGAQDQSQRRAFVLRPMSEGARESPSVSGSNVSQWAVKSQVAEERGGARGGAAAFQPARPPASPSSPPRRPAPLVGVAWGPFPPGPRLLPPAALCPAGPGLEPTPPSSCRPYPRAMGCGGSRCSSPTSGTVRVRPGDSGGGER